MPINIKNKLARISCASSTKFSLKFRLISELLSIEYKIKPDKLQSKPTINMQSITIEANGLLMYLAFPFLNKFTREGCLIFNTYQKNLVTGTFRTNKTINNTKHNQCAHKKPKGIMHIFVSIKVFRNISCGKSYG